MVLRVTVIEQAIVVVQARTGSKRLPGKVLMEIAGRPMIDHVMERAEAIGAPVVLATTVEPADDTLVERARAAGWRTYRGSEADVLDRFVCAIPSSANAVVRITADCPLFDPLVGRRVLATLLAEDLDYVNNTMPPTYPDGLDCEAVRPAALHTAWREATLPADREHVTSFIWRQPDRFRLATITHDRNLSALRWTVDDARDLTFVRAIAERLQSVPLPQRHALGTVLTILDAEPGLHDLNLGTRRNDGYARSVAADDTGSVSHS